MKSAQVITAVLALLTGQCWLPGQAMAAANDPAAEIYRDTRAFLEKYGHADDFDARDLKARAELLTKGPPVVPILLDLFSASQDDLYRSRVIGLLRDIEGGKIAGAQLIEAELAKDPGEWTGRLWLGMGLELLRQVDKTRARAAYVRILAVADDRRDLSMATTMLGREGEAEDMVALERLIERRRGRVLSPGQSVDYASYGANAAITAIKVRTQAMGAVPASVVLSPDPSSAKAVSPTGGDSLPADAVRFGPAFDPASANDYYNVFPAGTVRHQQPLPQMIGYEEFFDGQLVRQLLYRDGIKHGLQRSWHRKGGLATEEPYGDGMMDGEFRSWDQAGQLVARYFMRQGSGTRRVYDSRGMLVEEVEFKGNLPDGISMEYDERFLVRSIVWKKEERVVGNGFSFYLDGSLKRVAARSMAGQAHGPSLAFSNDGSVLRREWYVRGVQVEEKVYQEKTASDPTLPPYYPDAVAYKQLVTSAVREVLDRYQNAPRVKIPLEFDETGKPLLAPTK